MWDGLDPRDADGRERDASDPREAEPIEPRNAFTLRLCFGKALFVFSGRMLMHLFLMLMKIKLIHSGSCSDLESLDVACLTLHSFPLLLLLGRVDSEKNRFV